MSTYTSENSSWQTSTLDEAYVISQDVSAIQAEVRALAYLNATIPTADFATMTGVLDAIEKGPRSHVKTRNKAVVWSWWSAIIGGLLAILGLGFNEVLGWAIWGWLQTL